MALLPAAGSAHTRTVTFAKLQGHVLGPCICHSRTAAPQHTGDADHHACAVLLHLRDRRL
jgi:hypothetical protein